MKYLIVFLSAFSLVPTMAQTSAPLEANPKYEAGLVMYNLRLEDRYNRVPTVLGPEALFSGVFFRYHKGKRILRAGAGFRQSQGISNKRIEPMLAPEHLFVPGQIPIPASTKQWEANAGFEYALGNGRFKPYFFGLLGYRNTLTILSDRYYQFILQRQDCLTGVEHEPGVFRYRENSMYLNQGLGLRFTPSQKFSMSLESSYEFVFAAVHLNREMQSTDKAFTNLNPFRVMISYCIN